MHLNLKFSSAEFSRSLFKGKKVPSGIKADHSSWKQHRDSPAVRTCSPLKTLIGPTPHEFFSLVVQEQRLGVLLIEGNDGERTRSQWN